jgi:hypothetical protein
MLNDEESAKLAMSEAATKVADLKKRLWEISKNAVIILAFLAAIFHGDVKYAVLGTTHWAGCLKGLILLGYFLYFCSIFWQASSNTKRYMGIYRKAGQKLYSSSALREYFDDNPENMIEDEGRLTWFLFLVVLAFFLLVIVQIVVGPSTTPVPVCCSHLSER